jgi:hypothetical protein
MAQERSLSNQETDEKFGRLWFASLAKFHRVSDPTTWVFDEQHVIAFLRSKVKEKVPAWKRLKIVQGVIWYQNELLCQDGFSRTRTQWNGTRTRKGADDRSNLWPRTT